MTHPKRKAIVVKKYYDEWPDKVIFKGSLEEAKKLVRRQSDPSRYDIEFAGTRRKEMV